MNLEKMCELQIQFYNRRQAILAREENKALKANESNGANAHRAVKPNRKPYDTGTNLPS